MRDTAQKPTQKHSYHKDSDGKVQHPVWESRAAGKEYFEDIKGIFP